MARQPIFDRKMRVAAYELLHRSELPFALPLSESDSNDALINAVAEIGLTRLSGRYPAFFNVSEGLLLSDSLRILPPDRVVLEILEDIVPTPRVLQAIKDLREMGYQIALDDFSFLPHQLPMVGLVDVIKVDVLACRWSRLEAEMAKLRSNGARLLAEKVETTEMYEQCRFLGFDLFQGYFFARPETMTAQVIPPNRLVLLQLLAEVHRPNASADDLAKAIAQDPGLALRLMRLVNSVALALPRRLESVQMAVTMLGSERIRSLAVLLAAKAKDGSPELARIGLIRARVCEELAKELGLGNPSIHFTIGLLSVLDSMLGVPIQIIVEHLSLSPEVAQALTEPHEGSPSATCLNLVLLHEKGAWEQIGNDIMACKVSRLYSSAAHRCSTVLDVA